MKKAFLESSTGYSAIFSLIALSAVSGCGEDASVAPGAGGAEARGKSSAGGATGKEDGEGNGAAGSGNDASGMGTAGANSGPVTPPGITKFSPSSGERGIADDQIIELQFSEPMNPSSVEAALSLVGPTETAYQVAWSDDHTGMSIIPDQPLVYGEGTVLMETAIPKYTVTIELGAEDAEGHKLNRFTFSFSTLRRITVQPDVVPALTGSLVGDANEATTIWVGDTVSNERALGNVSFDLSDIPNRSQVQSAVLSLLQDSSYGDPFDDLTTELYPGIRVLQADYDSIAESANALSTKGNVLGELSGLPMTRGRQLVVTEEVARDVAAGFGANVLSQYVLNFAGGTSEDGEADLVLLDTPKLEIVYLE